MPSPDQMFTLDTVQTKVTQPTTTITAQKPIDTSVEDKQFSAGIQAFGNALGSMAETSKKKRIADDISLAQEAAIRNEVMPGGLLPIAQRAFEDTQDIETANKAYADIEVFTEGNEVMSIMHNSLLTPKQKNDQINAAVDNLWRTSSVSIRNPEALIQLKSKVDGLKVKNMKDVWGIDKSHRYGVALSAINGQIDNGFDQNKIDPTEIFTGNWVKKVVGQLRTSLPWVNEDDAKLSVFKMLTDNENMLTHSDIVTNVMQSEFSKGVTFSALAHASSTKAGEEIRDLYKKYLTNADNYYKTERLDEILGQEYLNDLGAGKGNELMSALQEPGDTYTIMGVDGERVVTYEERFEALEILMIDQSGAERSEFNKFVTVWEKAQEYTKPGVGSQEYLDAETLILTGSIKNGKQLREYVYRNNLNSDAYSFLNTTLGADNTEYKANIETGKARITTVSSGLLTVIKDRLKPESGLMNLISDGLAHNSEALIGQLDNKNSELHALLGKSRLDADKYIKAIRLFASAKHDINREITDESRLAIQEGNRAPNFDKINSKWEKIAQNFISTLDEDINKLGESDTETAKAEAPAPVKKVDTTDKTKTLEKDVSETIKEIKQEKTEEKEEEIFGEKLSKEAKNDLVNSSNWVKKNIPPSVEKWANDVAEDLTLEKIGKWFTTYKPFDPDSFWQNPLGVTLDAITPDVDIIGFGRELLYDWQQDNLAQRAIVEKGVKIKANDPQVMEALQKKSPDWLQFNLTKKEDLKLVGQTVSTVKKEEASKGVLQQLTGDNVVAESMADFGSLYYNASAKARGDTKEQDKWKKNALEHYKRYKSGTLSKTEKANVKELTTLMDDESQTYVGDLKHIPGVSKETFKDMVVMAYGAETLFGTSPSKVSETGVVGQLQTERTTLMGDYVRNKQGKPVKPLKWEDGVVGKNFGTSMAAAVGLSIHKEIDSKDGLNKYVFRVLGKPAQKPLTDKDIKARLMSKDKKFSFFSGMAVMLNKLQAQRK